ncbi:MAG: PcfB family protein [Firmicutes bacterium]|nr:PcfB family protein [Bacillota bacterium]
MNSSESAEAIVKMMLEGTEVAARITGEGAKNIAVLLYTMHKEQKLTKGKTNLNNMLKTGSSLKIFSLMESDLKKFHQEAKRYGVLYTAVTDKKHKLKDGMVDLYVKAEDALKVNRIIDKFKLSAVDIAEIHSEAQRDKIDAMLKDAKERGVEVKSDEEKLVDEIMSKPIQKEGNEMSNPEVAKTEKSPLSKPSYENKKNSGVASKKKRKSVRKLLKEIKEEINTRELTQEQKERLRSGEVKEITISEMGKDKVNHYKNTENGIVKNNKKINKGKER